MNASCCDHSDVELSDGTADAKYLAALEAVDMAETVEIHLQTVIETWRYAENWGRLSSRIPAEPHPYGTHTDT